MKSELSKYVEEILFTEEEIDARVKEMGRQITEDYKGDTADLLLVCILKGASIFMADLLKELDLPVEIDFMAVSSYGKHTVSTGDVRILKDLEQRIAGKNVLIVEDIVDSGYTLSYLVGNLHHRGAKSVRIVTLLNKEARRVVDIHADYVGFDIPDSFVIGYGLDFNQKLRNLPYIATLKRVYYDE